MNENINLCEILKDCPKGTEFWSPLLGIVKFDSIECKAILVYIKDNDRRFYFMSNGFIQLVGVISAEPMLFPSKDQPDWSKWQYPKPKFDPKTLKPFDRVLVRIGDGDAYCWFADFVSIPGEDSFLCTMSNKDTSMIIPYNEETKHLVGTKDEAPDFYRYWED